jgi:hypothetical protein
LSCSPVLSCAVVEDHKDILRSVYSPVKDGTTTILAGQISAHSFKLDENGRLPEDVQEDTAAFFEEELVVFNA